MSGPRGLARLDRRFWMSLALLVAVGLGVRLTNVFIWRPTTAGCALVMGAGGPVGDGSCYETQGDALYHLVQGEAIARGDWYVSSPTYYFFGEVQPGAGDPPLYAAFLGLVSALGGTGETTGRMVGVAVLAALVLVGALVTRRVAGERAAIVAVGLSTLFAVALAAASTLPVHRIEGGTGSQAVLPALGDRVISGPGFALLDGTSHRAASSLLGAVGVALLGVLAGRLAGQRAGLIAAGLAAVYPMLWINDGMILSESLYVPLLAVAVLAGLHLWQEPSRGRALACGVACAVASLARAEAALLLVTMVPAIALGARDLRLAERIRVVLVAGAAAVAVVAPWLVWNVVRFEEPALMTSQTWAVFSAGSCDTAYGLADDGKFLGYYGANCFGELVEQGRAEWPPLDLDESERDAWTRDATVDYVKDHLDHLPVVMVARVGRMWDLYEPGQNVELNWMIEGRGKRASEIGLAMYYPLVALAVGGVLVLRRRRQPVSPFVGMAVVVTVTAAITFGTTRYRAPLEAAIVVLAAVALDAALRRWGSPVAAREDEVHVDG